MIESMLTGMDAPGGTSVCFSSLEISESEGAGGAVRVALAGELDLAGTARVSARLDELRRSRRRVRLDLSALEFIDCSGMGVILAALADARADGWALEVERQVSPLTARVIALAELGPALWPADGGVSPAA